MNAGVGYYHKTSDPNILRATWTSPQLSSQGIGTGVVKGDNTKGFAGKYVVTYYLPDGSEAGTFDLLIEKIGPVYKMSWRKAGEEMYEGLGIETPEGLSIAYSRK
jgi:hypothetical protein